MKILKQTDALDMGAFDWRLDPEYQRVAQKLRELATTRERLETDLRAAISEVQRLEQEADHVTLLAVAGQSNEETIRQVTTRLQAEMQHRDATAAELDRVERLLPGADQILREIARKVAQPYAVRLKAAYRRSVEELAMALHKAALVNANVKALHEVGVLQYDSTDLGVDARVSGLPMGQWSELDQGDVTSKLALWLKEFRSYGFEV